MGEKPPRFGELRRPSAKPMRTNQPHTISRKMAGRECTCEGCEAVYTLPEAGKRIYRPDLCPGCKNKRNRGHPDYVRKLPPVPIRVDPDVARARMLADEVARQVKYRVRRERHVLAKEVRGSGVLIGGLAVPDVDDTRARALAELANEHGVLVPDAPALPPVQKLSVEAAVSQEMASRELARRKFLHFVQRRRPKYQAGWFHIDLCARLERFAQAVIDGKSPRLIIEAPPRSGKSTLLSEDFAPWFWGHFPEAEIIGTAYSSQLAFEFSRKVQDTMRSADYLQLFDGLTVREGNEAIETWKNNKGGSYLAAGAGGPITGRGAHALLIEDPFKNRADADSSVVRKSIWDWYTSTAYTRLAPGGGVCVVHTRWHQDDLIGRLRGQMKEGEKIERETGVWPAEIDRWEIVSYPAIATEDEEYRKIGEALHPERYPLSALLRIRRTVGPRDWSALYQQNPVPEEGAYFTKDMIRYIKRIDLPPGKVFVTADLAISKAQYADYTVFMAWLVDAVGNMYLIDCVRAKMNATEIVEQIVRWQAKHTPFVFGIERGTIYEAILPLLEKTIREQQLYAVRVEPVSVSNRDKEARARTIQGRMGQGKVLMIEGADYLDWLIDEILSFPHGKNDDGVDTMAHAGRMVNDISFQPQVVKKSASWRDKLHRYVSGSGDSTRHPAMSA